MKIVIQCAGRKKQDAGKLTTMSGEKVRFVAHPEQCRLNDLCFHPDDISNGRNCSWREHLRSYNATGENPLKLYQAGNLYKPAIYQDLVDNFGKENVFILSAGWGLIRSDYLIPYYDITFSNQGDLETKRLPTDKFKDLNHLKDCAIDPVETIYFFGGQSYLPLYQQLTREIVARKVIYHSQDDLYALNGYVCFHYDRYTNWHYSCAKDFILGKIPR